MQRFNIIMSTCVFSYFQNISIHAMLVTTDDFFFLLNNIKEELKAICGKYNRETIQTTYSVSIISCKDMCELYHSDY